MVLLLLRCWRTALAQSVFIFPDAPCPQTMAAIHPDSQRLSDRFRTRREPLGSHLHLFLFAFLFFLLQSLGLPCRGPGTSLRDRAHVLSGSQGRLCCWERACIDKENRPATMHHRHTADICVSLHARLVIVQKKKKQLKNNNIQTQAVL